MFGFVFWERFLVLFCFLLGFVFVWFCFLFGFVFWAMFEFERFLSGNFQAEFFFSERAESSGSFGRVRMVNRIIFLKLDPQKKT